VYSSTIVFASSGRLLALKAFEAGLKAFARCDIENAEYWIIGDGPERNRLEKLVADLKITEKVRFHGMISRDEALGIMGKAHILVHPSLHDSGGWVCPEAMAMGKAVICLNLGGPGAQVSEKTGIKVEPIGYEESVEGIARAMQKLAADRDLLRDLGENGKREVAERYIWENKCRYYSGIYFSIIQAEHTGVNHD
jgi:glycosyltransferase involved in cell wall biosynthesis